KMGGGELEGEYIARRGAVRCCMLADRGSSSWISRQDNRELVNSLLLAQVTIHSVSTLSRHHFPIVKNNLSPMSPSPGLSIPPSEISPSTPAIQISVPSCHSSAALFTPSFAPRMEITTTRRAPQSRSVWIAA